MPYEVEEIPKAIDDANLLLHSIPHQAEEIYRSLLQSPLTKEQWYEIQPNLAFSLWQQSKIEEAQAIYKILLDEGTKHDLKGVVGDAYLGLARIASEEGSLEQGLDFCKKAINLFQKMENPEKEAIAINVLAVIYYSKGNINKAIYWFKSCLQTICEPKSPVYTNALNNIGLSYRLKGDIEKAEEYFQLAIENAKKEEFGYVLSTFYNNLAETLCLRGDYQRALFYFNQGLTSAQENHDSKNLALVSTSYANYLIQTGQLEDAYQSIIIALQIYDKINDPLGEILCLIALANYWMVKGHLKKALKQLEKSWNIVETSGVTESAIDVLVLLAEINESLGNTNKAYSYLKIANRIAYERDSDLARVQVLVQRGLINVNQNQFHEAELILNEAIWFAKKIQHHEIQYKAQIILARNYLGQFVQDFRKEDFETTMMLIQEAKELAKQQKLIPRYINALIIQGMLFSSNDNEDQAKLALSEAKTLANERGMIIQARNAQERLSLVAGSEKSTEIKKPFKKIVLALIMDEISRATTTYLESNFTEVDLEETFMTVFTIDEEVGTRILETENVDIEDPFWYKQIHQIASLYSISLGQGQAYHEGLFGPLPFGETDLRSIIFTRIISKREETEEVETNNYVLFCLVFPREMMPLFYDRKRVEIFFTENTDHITSLTQITQEFLQNLHENIIAEIIADIYDPMMHE